MIRANLTLGNDVFTKSVNSLNEYEAYYKAIQKECEEALKRVESLRLFEKKFKEDKQFKDCEYVSDKVIFIQKNTLGVNEKLASDYFFTELFNT